MKLKSYIQFINESTVHIDERLPSYNQMIYYFQSIKDEYRIQILYSYTNKNESDRVNYNTGPEYGPPYYTLKDGCIMDGYYIVIYSPEVDRVLESEITHCLENIQIELPEILVNYTYNNSLMRYCIYVTYNSKLIN